MKYRIIVLSIIVACIVFAQSAVAAELAIKSGDTTQSLLASYKGKVVTLRLTDGDEMTGKVRFVSKELVQLEELSGRDYYDGVVDVRNITAVIVKVKK